MLSRKNFHCRLLKFEVASWPCTFDALYVSIKRCFDYMHYCTAVKSVLDIICLHRWLAAKRHVVFWLSVCQVSVIMYQKFVNTIPYKLLVGIWIYNLDAAGNKDNWLGFEVKRSKVKVTVRPSVWHSVMLSGQIWSEKHLGSFEGHVYWNVNINDNLSGEGILVDGCHQTPVYLYASMPILGSHYSSLLSTVALQEHQFGEGHLTLLVGCIICPVEMYYYLHLGCFIISCS